LITVPVEYNKWNVQNTNQFDGINKMLEEQNDKKGDKCKS
jgi:excinuclease ABC subunit A